jgi:glycerol dehydrogenase-like iron-containing ADH family enzyme
MIEREDVTDATHVYRFFRHAEDHAAGLVLGIGGGAAIGHLPHPRAPSSPMPVMMMPTALPPAALASERNSTSTEGLCRLTSGPSNVST